MQIKIRTIKKNNSALVRVLTNQPSCNVTTNNKYLSCSSAFVRVLTNQLPCNLTTNNKYLSGSFSFIDYSVIREDTNESKRNVNYVLASAR
jgi:hypothetical protein